MRVVLEALDGDGWPASAGGSPTPTAGCPACVADALVAGVHRVTFPTGDWFAAEGINGFYPQVTVVCRSGTRRPTTTSPC